MIVVTGPMRSGTTPVAKMLNQGGVWMGVSEVFASPFGQPEYEDLALQALCHGWLRGNEPDGVVRRVEFRAYIRGRMDLHNIYRKTYAPGLIKGWGVKTPFLAPYLHDFQDAAQDEGEDFKLVTTNRPDVDTTDSLDQKFAVLKREHRSKTMVETLGYQKRIRKALVKWDATVHIDHQEIMEDPKQVAFKLSRGVGRTMNLDHMVRGIGEEWK